jgi:uncharacterized membrane-anchored protein
MPRFPALAAASLLSFSVATASAQQAPPSPAGDAVNVDEPAPEQVAEADKLARRARVAELLSPETRALFESWDEAAFEAFGDKVRAEDVDEDNLSDAESEILGAYQFVLFEESLTFQTGEIVLGDNLATLRIGEELRFLGPVDAKRVLVDLWGNPPGAEPLGMLFPIDVSPASEAGWGVVVTYSDDGHVDDGDAADIDYDDLLEQMQADVRDENEARSAQGFEPVTLTGWAESPHYDGRAHNLYWAKELAFEGSPEHTLNYSIRVLGRTGVLELNAVAGISQLAMIKPKMQRVLTMVTFNPGQRYDDFDSSIDKAAAYGVGALVAGKIMAKTGLLAGLLKLLIAAKKLLILVVVGVGAAVRGFLRRRREPEQESSAAE